MTHLVVTGYASLDHVLVLAGDIAKDRTTRVTRRDPAAWPRAGGCPTYVAQAAVRAGQRAAPVVWIGDDAPGRVLVAQYASAGLDGAGVATLKGGRSPISVLAYQPDGAVSCLYDPGFAGQERLSEAQAALIAGASHLCLTVGPGHLVDAILGSAPASARLYWAVKNDTQSFDDTARARLSQRADVIFCNHAEQELILGGTAVRVVTHGAAGAEVIGRTGSIRAPVPRRITASDATGAGDSFAGGYIAAEMTGITDPAAALQAGMAAAAQLLMERQDQ